MQRFLVFEIEFGDIMNVAVVDADDKEEAGEKPADIFNQEKPVPSINIYNIEKLNDGWTKINK